MNLEEAHDYMDLLLDKADQPYFTTEEKNKFLNLAISDFINMNYQKMTADEDSRRALSGCVDWHSFSLTAEEIVDGDWVYDSSYPALSLKYTSQGIPSDPTDLASSTFTDHANDERGFFTFGNHYVLPKQHLYVLSIGIKFYNKDHIIDPTDGTIYTGVTEADVVISPTVSAKSRSTRDFYELSYNNDPFNKSGEDAPFWQYVENNIIFSNDRNISYINMQVITLPTVSQAFSEFTVGSSTAPYRLVFAEHYQKQIIKIAIERMTKVDVGLMTPPS